jgi:hypothetical protein
LKMNLMRRTGHGSFKERSLDDQTRANTR